ncbi:winged helix-turn-helix transcriptional regulator [Kibdelosporangium phytohabitans]|uniref:HTH hxlR-type domain-containing protein n=1 Tax=Kibdelosporangium phytohabitans TaxID=860235 RepID=A0A0N9I546_9PSEU|nr:helix-turn-helix domain-containing protein [Kibdelosporangium phytohabitans]ALG15194.1 hypothetical protein AOZ06_31225 [Kibdelosporangium phytohabitans]MBE1461922.1 DNA-binding HxlR family transcriptional regulator [Kibdelosporangium phytohabitans]
MIRRTYDGQLCTIARALEVVGERWTLLIIRDALLGVTRFEGFRSTLGVPRNVLTDRLNLLVANGVLERVVYSARPVRHEYLLTAKGRGLAPVIVTLMEWGDEYFTDEAHGPPRRIVHEGCGGQAVSQLVCVRCGSPLGPLDMTVIPLPAPGAESDNSHSG